VQNSKLPFTDKVMKEWTQLDHALEDSETAKKTGVTVLRERMSGLFFSTTKYLIRPDVFDDPSNFRS